MMRRLLVMVICAAVATVAGCGGGTSSPSSSEQAAPAAAAAVADPVDSATAGHVTGTVTFAGTPPKPAAVAMDSDPICKPEGGAATDETVLVGSGGSLQNVFVYVRDGLGNLRFPVTPTAVRLDQKGCRYAPHVLGIQVGQTLEIVNSDTTLHNVHALAVDNREFNMGQPLAGMKTTHTFSTKEVMVPFKCDVHGWMRAYIGVLDHPYFAVTGPDGSFDLKRLPPGTYTIEAWHERLGTQTQSVTIGAGETGKVAFSFKRPAT